MCGLVGVLAFNDFRVTPELIKRMNDTIIHRGPDGEGVWVSDKCNIGLGHRRLSIIDLSQTASQPMVSQDGNIQLVYNGEIYNHAEIRKELEQLGVGAWRTDHSDTEVVLKAYQQWGFDCLEKFRGMFAIALWDESKQLLWMVRDRLGIKPLYYTFHHNRITFGSEIKALLQDKEIERKVDEEAFFHYLSFLTTPSPMTLFRGIKKMEPGTWMTVSAKGDVRTQRYWDVWDNVDPMVNVPEEEVYERVIESLKESVALRKVADVPVGVFLSGGIDSSTNAALFSEHGKKPVSTFSIGYDAEYETYKSELHYAKRMAKEVNADYHERLLNIDDLLDFLPKMVELQDEPIADPVCVPVYYVSKLARDNGMTVCQVGEGADELFWGYDSWKVKLRLQQWGDVPGTKWLQKGLACGIRALGKDERLEYEFLRRSSVNKPVFWGGAEAFTESQKSNLLSPRLKKQFAGRTSWEALDPIWQRFEEKAWDKHPLNWMSYVDLSYRLPELLLMRVDKMSMGVSLEGRVPFLDHKFVELAMSIPAKLKTKGGVQKSVLKHAVKGIIPDELIHRKT